MKLVALAGCAVFFSLAGGLAGPAKAQIASFYSELDTGKDCAFSPLEGLSEQEKDELLGNTAVCEGLPNYPVYFAESDLRQFVAYGGEKPEGAWPGGFGQFNHVGATIEWRTKGGRPFATILRWFIENANPQTGSPEAAFTGQVLVISTVAQPSAAGGSKKSCPAGYVDTKSNADANDLAREVADAIAAEFVCGIDRPRFHGKRGPLSGDPQDLLE